MTATKAARILLGAAGVGVMAYGIVGFATAPEITARTEIGQWLLAGLLAHDALLAPTVFLLGAVAFRITGSRLRGRLAALLMIAGSLLLISLPALTQQGNNSNHTVLPLDYARNLGVLLAGLVGLFILLSAADTLRTRRRRAHLHTAEAAEPEAEPKPKPSPPAANEPDAPQPPPLSPADAQDAPNEADTDGAQESNAQSSNAQDSNEGER
jgi:hypothetical protein